MADTTITIRAATLEDYPRASQVISETFDFHQQAVPWMFQETASPPPTRSYVSDLLAGDDGALFVAEHRDQIVGFLTVRLLPIRHEPYLVPRHPATVDTLGILREWQRRGIGRMLMQAAEEWAKSRGATHLQINVWEFNRGAIALYESMGYLTASRNMYKPF